MNIILTIDWRFILALGSSAGMIIGITKLNSESSEHVLIHAIDTAKEIVAA